MRRLAGRAGLAAASVLVTALALEGILRLTQPTPREMWQIGGLFRIDDQLIFSLRPNVQRSWTTSEFTEVASTNAMGLRDDELAEPGPDTTRIIVLGDSMTFGHGVANDEAYPNQLEKLLKEAGRQADVINAGVKGYGTDQSYRFFTTRLMGLTPQVVVFGVYWNDVSDNMNQALYSIDGGTLVPLDARAHHIYVIGSIDERVPTSVRRTFLYNALMSGLRRAYDRWAHPSQPADRARSKVRLEVEHLVRLGRERGFRVVVIGVPYRDRPPGEYRFLFDRPVEGALGEDLSARPVWREKRDRLFFRIDPHFTPDGHRVLAEQVLELLVRNGL